jgi:integrase
MSTHLRLVEPSNENRSVPVRPANAELRTREYLTAEEVEKLIKAARDGRYGHRDAALILIAFRHGLRAVEICDLEWSQVEFGRSASLHVRRAKNGKPSVHPLRGDEIRALRELRRQFPDSSFVFATERSGPFTADAVNRLIKRIGVAYPSRFTATCCAMPAATPWRIADSKRFRQLETIWADEVCKHKGHLAASGSNQNEKF